MDINAALMNRDFSLWDYNPTHGRLLIRSPRSSKHSKNLDIILFDVSYMDLACELGNIRIQKVSSLNLFSQLKYSKYSGKNNTFYKIYSKVATGVVIAHSLLVIETAQESYQSSIDGIDFEGIEYYKVGYM